MGYGYSYKCKKCGKEYNVFLGVGMMMPKMYERIIKAINDDKYGLECKTLLNSKPYVAVDVYKELYICRTCGKWHVMPIMNLYEPNNPEAIRHKQYGIKTVEEWGSVPYVTSFDLKYDYHLMKKWIHTCECGKRMHRASKQEILSLECPYCGEKNNRAEPVNWD